MNEPTPTTVTWWYQRGVRETEPQDGWELDGIAWLKISGSAEQIQALVTRFLADEARRYGVDFNTLTGSGHYVWDRVTRQWAELAEASELLAPDMTLVSTPDLTKPNDLAQALAQNQR